MVSIICCFWKRTYDQMDMLYIQGVNVVSRAGFLERNLNCLGLIFESHIHYVKREHSFVNLYHFQGTCKIEVDAYDLTAMIPCLVLAVLIQCFLQCWSIDCCFRLCERGFLLGSHDGKGSCDFVFVVVSSPLYSVPRSYNLIFGVFSPLTWVLVMCFLDSVVSPLCWNVCIRCNLECGSMKIHPIISINRILITSQRGIVVMIINASDFQPMGRQLCYGVWEPKNSWQDMANHEEQS